jgi:FtsZ-binding cell division protein ZapB
MRDHTATAGEIDRLGERIEQAAVTLRALRAERDQLRHERDRLARRLEEAQATPQGPGGPAMAVELEALKRDRRAWQGERRAVADRIEVLLAKLERLPS